jgi:predicted secreted hydrolase
VRQGVNILCVTAGILLAGCLLFGNVCRASGDFLQASETRVFRFPRDHADHPGFRTEWWYYSGNLVSADERAFGFQLTFFRIQLKPEEVATGSPWRSNQVFFAHFAVADIKDKRFLMAEKAGRGTMGISGASFDSGVVRVFLHGWETVIQGEMHHLRAQGSDCSIDLELVSEKPPVLHGKEGLSRKGPGPGQASYYYSVTRLRSRGVLKLGDKTFQVSGLSWMDHEFSSSVLSEDQTGWDWMGLQLSDNQELMIYVLRHRDGSIDPFSSGTLINSDGTSVYLPKETFSIKPTDSWTSKESSATYPSGWEVEIFPYEMVLTVEPSLRNQELITEESTRVTYWEGSVRVAGTAAGQKVTGSGYTELTGYTGQFKLGSQQP